MSISSAFEALAIGNNLRLLDLGLGLETTEVVKNDGKDRTVETMLGYRKRRF